MNYGPPHPNERRSRDVAGGVSVITPAFNAAATVAETIESLLAQTFVTWEAIVVDDGSLDDTAAVVQRFVERDGRVRLIRQPNRGESAARNTGIRHARYERLLFLDADDWIDARYLETLQRPVLVDPTLDAVHCLSARIAGDGTRVTDTYLPPSGDMFDVLAERVAFPLHACIVRRSLVEQVGCFDVSLRTCPDWDLWQRIARTGARFAAIREVLAFYRMRPDSASMDADQMVRDAICVLKRGHTVDPRVTRPHPDHLYGLPPERMRCQQYYIVCWSAGVLLGRETDARRLLRAVQDETCPHLSPHAVASCIFESAILPRCEPPHAWQSFWPRIRPPVEAFLRALEEQSMTPGLARQGVENLERLIQKHARRPHQSVAGGAPSPPAEEIQQLDEDETSVGWWLRVASDNTACLITRSDAVGSARVVITKAETALPHDIQLNVPGVRVQAAQCYTLRARARADDARRVFLGVSQAHEPWKNLGLYQELNLTREWQGVELSFAATMSDDHARLHFDVGAAPVSVEITAVSFALSAPRQA